MASIRKRILPSGKTAWQVDYKDGAGKRRARQFMAKRDADAFLVRARAQVAAGTHVADSASSTVSEAADLWLGKCEAEGLEAATTRQYRQHAELHIKPLIGATKLSRLTAPAVQGFVDQLLETRSRAMARRALNSLKAIISEAQRRGLIGHNPAQPARVPSRRSEDEETEVAIPPKEHLRSMLSKSAEFWPLTRKTPSGRIVTCCWRPALVTAIFTGLRASELRGLAWDHVDLQGGVIHVRQRADRFNKMGPPKSRAGRRTVPLAPMVINTLKEWKLACPKTRLNLVFPSERGEILWAGNLYWQGWRALLDHCELLGPDGGAPYKFHSLRHAAVSLMIEHGWTPKKVQQVIGHGTIQMTLDTYGHLWPTPDDDLAAMAQIEAKLLS